MKKLLLVSVIVTMVQCYRHYPLQDASVLDISQSVLRSISNFGWNNDGNSQSHQKNSEPDVIVMIVEYQSNEHNHKSPSRGPGWRNNNDGQYSPSVYLPPQPPATLPNGGTDNFWYPQSYQPQIGKEPLKGPNRPVTTYDSSNFNDYEHRYYNNKNYENSAHHNGPFDTQNNGRPYIQHQGNINNQDYAGSNQFYENNYPDHQKFGSYTPGFENQYQNNKNNHYPDNIYQEIESDQQRPNNGGLISGTQNPFGNNPSTEVSPFPTLPSSQQNEDKISGEQELPKFLPLDPTDNKMESETEKSVEDDEDFRIDIRFKGD